MKKKNNLSVLEELAAQSARFDEDYPIVETKWAVEEVTPAYNTGGYYDQDIPEEAVTVSPKFDSREEAERWMDEHEADKGKYLALIRLTGREHRFVNWTRSRMLK